MVREFKPTQHYKLKKNAKHDEDYELKDGKKIELDLYKGTTLGDMISWLKENGTDAEKTKFKYELSHKHVYVPELDDEGNEVKTKSGKVKKVKTNEIVECKENEYNVMGAKLWFFTEFAPTLVPKAKVRTKPTAKELLADL